MLRTGRMESHWLHNMIQQKRVSMTTTCKEKITSNYSLDFYLFQYLTDSSIVGLNPRDLIVNLNDFSFTM
ncbi:hypothetical protein EB796_018196 [Bugula neritina]|uniref:Uncharacterized protein n=1 Tax=Bugula neritina TaxID=10212 RepID=A0A7J7JB66_BUGNE|nr:hypothetical protein EB796_018196 [Bugula neritina]